MGFLRRLLGGGRDEGGPGRPADRPIEADVGAAEGGVGAADGAGAADADLSVGSRGADADLSVDEAERAHELELAKQEAARLDELQQRQLRFADYAWIPPAQGGERRADDEDRPAEG